MSMIPLLHAPTPDDMRSVIYPTADGNPPPSTPQTPANTQPAAPAPTPAPTGPTQEQRDGQAYLRSVLDDYGLGELSEWAWGQIVAGNSPTMVLQQLREQPLFRQRFHVIFEREQAGLSPMSPAEVVAYERNARQMANRMGLGFLVSQALIDRWIVGDVGLPEAADRVTEAKTYFYANEPFLRAEMDRLYGNGSGSWLDPNHAVAMILDSANALPMIQREIAAARESGAAQRSGFGGLSRTEAEWMADLGINPSQAVDAFGNLVDSKELFADLPGGIDEGVVTRQQQLEAAFAGDAEDQAFVERKRAARLAVFKNGGGFSADKEGFVGLGSAR